MKIFSFSQAIAHYGLVFVMVLTVCHSALMAQSAPSFKLPLFDRAGFVESSSLFNEHDATFLIFWHTGCAGCEKNLRGCDGFYRIYSDEGVAVLGIISADEEASQLRRVIYSSGVSFPQALDSGMIVFREYGISPGEFSVVLVGRGGVIVAKNTDPEGDIVKVLKRMLLNMSLPADETMRKPEASISGFTIGGISRLRFLSVSSNVSNPVGAYGEHVTPGNMINYRMELEIKKKLTPSMIIGGIVRLSNEGEKVLESGPEYLGREWGSAFAEFEEKRLSLRLGYFDIHSTPLTLMRWDWNDNPRIGGDAGCGCGAAAGTLLMESLEELGPELRFEGARVRATAWDVSGTAFYAMPIRALRTSYSEYRYTQEFAHYSKEVAGIEARWSRYFASLSDVVTLGTSIVHTWEDKSSVDFEALGYGAPLPWTNSTVASIFSKVPLGAFLSLELEHVLYNRHEVEDPVSDDEAGTTAAEAHGGTYGLTLKRGREFLARADYIRIEKEFYSPFAAISYEPNREGLRFNSRVRAFGDALSLSLFIKRLREIENEHPELPFERTSLIGCAADVDLTSGFGGSAGWMKKRVFRKGDSYDEFTERETVALSLRFRFNKSSYVQAQFERIKFDSSTIDVPSEKTDIVSFYFSSMF